MFDGVIRSRTVGESRAAGLRDGRMIVRPMPQEPWMDHVLGKTKYISHPDCKVIILYTHEVWTMPCARGTVYLAKTPCWVQCRVGGGGCWIPGYPALRYPGPVQAEQKSW